METMIYLAPIVGVLALLFAFTLSNNIKKQDAGNQRMQEIASYIHEGAQAFLMAEYRILIIFVALLFFILCICFKKLEYFLRLSLGALFSSAAGYFGMQVATKQTSALPEPQKNPVCLKHYPSHFPVVLLWECA